MSYKFRRTYEDSYNIAAAYSTEIFPSIWMQPSDALDICIRGMALQASWIIQKLEIFIRPDFAHLRRNKVLPEM